MIAVGLIEILKQLEEAQRERDQLLATCQAAHRMLALARTAGCPDPTWTRNNAEAVLYAAILEHQA